jgi:YVTN family beta-propeller protein
VDAFDGTVTVIDTTTNTVTATIPLGGSARCVAVTPDGKRVYVGDTLNSGIVQVIATATNTVNATIPVSGNQGCGVAVTPDGSKVYLANGNNTVWVITTATEYGDRHDPRRQRCRRHRGHPGRQQGLCGELR